MKMGPSGASGRTNVAEQLAACYGIADPDLDLRQMAVTCRQAVSVVDLDHVAVAAGPTRLDHCAVCRRHDGIAAFAVNVHSGVKLIRTAAKGISAETKFVVDLAEVGPHCRQVSGIGDLADRCYFTVDLRIFAAGLVGYLGPSAVKRIIACRSRPFTNDRFYSFNRCCWKLGKSRSVCDSLSKSGISHDAADTDRQY